MRRTDALIVGGGPAGSAAAITLARAGLRPLLFERNRDAADIVCGGFMGRDTLAALDRLGIDPAALGARPIDTLHLVAGRRHADIPLPFRAAGLSRKTLDAALLRHAAALGTGVERGIAVRALESGRVRLEGGITQTADALFLATGKHDLRGAARPRDGRDMAIGIRIALAPGPALDRAMAGRVELILFDRGWAGLLAQEDGQINLCLSVSGARLTAAGSIEQLLAEIAGEAPLLGERLAQARAQGPAQAVAQVPYGWIATKATPGLYRLGDQAAVIPSLAGDGVAIALASGRMGAAAMLAGQSAEAFQKIFARQAKRPIAIATTLRKVAENQRISTMFIPIAAHLPGLVRSLAIATRIEGH